MSKKTEYELTILVRPTLEEADRKAVIDAVQAMVTLDETEENKLTVSHWGKRQLAYLIDDQKEAYYVLFSGPMNGRAIREYDRSLMYNENILRHLFIRKEA
jgi:small subunit ribosomal protein S6